MRLRRASPLLLLLAAPSLIDALEVFSRDRINLTSDPPKREAEPELQETTGGTKFVAESAAAADAAKARESNTRTYRGKENAPVDGYDGKPHLGPFVDTSREESVVATPGEKTTDSTTKRPVDLDKWTQAGAQEWRLEEIPEKNDGVMNDDSRVGPKKGTDGTAGGISEKDKERKLNLVNEVGNKPQEPKEAPPLPHSEEEYITANGKESTRSGERVVDQRTKDDPKYGAGGYGIDLPENLPDRPQAKERSTEPSVSGASTGSGSDKWLVDTLPYTEGQRPDNGPKAPSKPSIPSLPISPDDASWHEWFHSFVLSLAMILFSEIGDKTFLVAALMAMRHPRILVFSSAFSALILMTVLSAVLGHAFPALLPKRLTTFAAAVLFLVFGAKSLRDGLAMDKDLGVGDEMKEVEAELEEKEHSMARARRSSSFASPHGLESGRGRLEPSPPSSRSPSPSSRKSWSGLTNLLSLVLSPAWVQTFIMTFLGEWGDRSQIATIAMAAGQDYWWVTLGAVTGHACCTGLAVIGGRALAGRVSMRVVTIGGAVAFLVFGVIYLFECLTETG